jgi:hypothetical protein
MVNVDDITLAISSSIVSSKAEVIDTGGGCAGVLYVPNKQLIVFYYLISLSECALSLVEDCH